MDIKKFNEIAFRKGLRQINEGGLNRIMYHGREHGMIVISANRSEIHSENKKLDLTDEYMQWCKSNGKEYDDKDTMDFWLRQRNKRCDQQLHDELKSSKYAFTPVYGGYHGEDNVTDSFEPSYIVYCHGKNYASDYYNFEDLYKDAIGWCKKYQQGDVYVQAPGEAPIYVNMDGKKSNKHESNNFKFNDETQMFFTTDKREKRDAASDTYGHNAKPQRFTADIQFENMYRKAGPSTYFERMKRRKLGEVFLDD